MDGTFLLPGQSPGMPPRCPPTEAQLERAPWPPSVVAQETFPRSPSEHSATKLDSLRSQSLRPEPAPGPVLVGDQPDPDPGLQDFSKDGYKAAHLSKCVCGGGGEGLSGIRLQSRWGTSCSRAQGPSEKATAARGSTSCPASASPSPSTSPLCSFSARCPSRRAEDGRLGPLHPRVLCPRAAAGHGQG